MNLRYHAIKHTLFAGSRDAQCYHSFMARVLNVNHLHIELYEELFYQYVPYQLYRHCEPMHL